MPDMYGRGYATGSFIGGMINPNKSGRQAYLQAQHNESTLDKLSDYGTGVEFRDGQYVLTPEGADLYDGRPLHARKALMMAPQRAAEAHKKQLEVGSSSIKLVMDGMAMLDKQVEEAKKQFTNEPEKIVEIERQYGTIANSMVMKFLPDIVKDDAAQMFIARNQNLNNTEMTQGIFKAILADAAGNLEKPGYQWRFPEMTKVKLAFEGLPDNMKPFYKPIVDQITSIPTAEITAAQAQAEQQKKELAFPYELDRERQKAQMQQGVQTAGAVARQKALLPGEIDKARQMEEIRLETAEKKVSGKQYVYSNDTYLVAKSLGIDPEDVAKNNITREQAQQIREEKRKDVVGTAKEKAENAARIALENRVTTEEVLKGLNLGKYGQHNIIQTSKGAFWVPTRPGSEGKPIPITDSEGQPLAKPIPSSQMDRISDLLTVKANIDKANELFKPDWVGPVAGRYYGLKGTFFDLPGEQVEFYNYVRDNQDALLRARSGAQINEQEYKRLVRFLPDPMQPSGNFKSAQKRFRDEVDIVLRNKVKMLGLGGYGSEDIIQSKKPSEKEPESKRFKILKVE